MWVVVTVGKWVVKSALVRRKYPPRSDALTSHLYSQSQWQRMAGKMASGDECRRMVHLSVNICDKVALIWRKIQNHLTRGTTKPNHPKIPYKDGWYYLCMHTRVARV